VFIWFHMNSYEGFMKFYEFIWFHRNIYEFIWIRMKSYEFICSQCPSPALYHLHTIYNINQSDTQSPKITLCLLSSKKDLSQSCRQPVTPSPLSFLKSLLWGTKSNAFKKSRNITSIHSLYRHTTVTQKITKNIKKWNWKCFSTHI
jgi:hypothetical protein